MKGKTKMSDSIYDFQTSILLQADDFAEAYKRCREGKNPRRDESGRLCSSCVNIPAIVNAAFACELYFKSMLEPPPKNEHNLFILYQKLPENKKQIIRDYVNDRFKGHPRYTFDYCMERAGDAFVNWRYVFENEHTDGFYGTFINEYLSFFENLIPVLKDVAHSTSN